MCLFFLLTVEEDEVREEVPSLTGTLITQRKWTFDIISFLEKDFVLVQKNNTVYAHTYACTQKVIVYMHTVMVYCR